VFHQGAIGARGVTRRNAPTVINAAFNHRNFWDGRANEVFNGSSGWGERDATAGVWVKNADGSVTKTRLHLANASLASQALGPPANTVEMSCTGRTLADLGRKLLLRRPLEHQAVEATDSVLGALSFSRSGAPQPALDTYYFKLVRQAFDPKYWSATQRGPFGAPAPARPGERPLPYSQLEANFGLFFGLALQLYEATLVSDDAPIDRSRRDAAGVPIDLSPSELRGLDAFRTAHCNVCHIGPAFTAAAVVTNARVALVHPEGFGDPGFKVSATPNLVDRARGLAGNGFVDTGFAATGVARTAWDTGLGGTDPFGTPYSFAAQYLKLLAGDTAAVRDPGVAAVRACDLTLPIARNAATANAFMFTRVDGIVAQPQSTAGCFNASGAFLPTPAAAARELANPATRKMLVLIDGAFKIPGLRNVELTGPYMHNGGMATLDQVLEFYARGGNFEEPAKQFGLVFPQPDLQLGAGVRADLIAFLKTLTDERVRYERAPFDHPALPLLHGHVTPDGPLASGNALNPALAPDTIQLIPAVGAGGRATPLAPFDAGLAP
jgi:cytochrome c peroxidase